MPFMLPNSDVTYAIEELNRHGHKDLAEKLNAIYTKLISSDEDLPLAPQKIAADLKKISMNEITPELHDITKNAITIMLNPMERRIITSQPQVETSQDSSSQNLDLGESAFFKNLKTSYPIIKDCIEAIEAKANTNETFCDKLSALRNGINNLIDKHVDNPSVTSTLYSIDDTVSKKLTAEMKKSMPSFRR